MTQLVLIRHGQASFGAANYDRLSETGERQARLVGRHLAAAGQHFDVMLAGDLQRARKLAGAGVGHVADDPRRPRNWCGLD